MLLSFSRIVCETDYYDEQYTFSVWRISWKKWNEEDDIMNKIYDYFDKSYLY